MQPNTTYALTPRQGRVIEGLIAGATMTDAAHAARVHRSTVYRWLRDDTEFQAALNSAKRVLRQSVHARMLLLCEKAVDVVADALEKGNVKAALTVLKGVGVLNGQEKLIG